MKVKVKVEEQLVTLKNLTAVQFALIEQLLAHVRLGDCTRASNAAFEMLNAFDECDDLEFLEMPEIEVNATTDGQVDGLDMWMESPTLVACESDPSCEYTQDGDCEGCECNCDEE